MMKTIDLVEATKSFLLAYLRDWKLISVSELKALQLDQTNSLFLKAMNELIEENKVLCEEDYDEGNDSKFEYFTLNCEYKEPIELEKGNILCKPYAHSQQGALIEVRKENGEIVFRDTQLFARIKASQLIGKTVQIVGWWWRNR